MSDTYCVILDKSTIDLIDQFRHRSLLQPSRRAATKALVRVAIRSLNKQRQARNVPHKSESTPTIAPAAAVAGGEQSSVGAA
jgi:hypothetical protein